ncbi:MAG: nicotinate (nicotinamide) nucleotide adenylyltransferase [Bacteroidales bacterium]
MKTGLYFGSFNPVHIGHLAIANYLVEFTPLDRIWFIVSPHNPLKNRKTLLSGYDRLKMTEIAIGTDNERFIASDIEFRLPVPSYTIDTVIWLKERNPSEEFSLIMGEDNLYTLHKWKNAKHLTELCDLYVYPRKGVIRPSNEDLDNLLSEAAVHLIKAPLIEISGTFIRKAIASQKDVRHFLPPGVWEFIVKEGFYNR